MSGREGRGGGRFEGDLFYKKNQYISSLRISNFFPKSNNFNYLLL